MPILLYDKRPPILTVTVNRPEVLNAISEELCQALYAAMDDFNRDPALKVAILTGEGRSFSSGRDLKETLPNDEYGQPPVTQGGRHKTLEPFSFKPLVAAIRGHCLAHGMDWLGHCDVVVASEDALFGLPEIKVGATAGFVWDNLCHTSPAGDGAKMNLSGQSISAGDAYRLGIVQEVVPKERLMEEARRIAEGFARLDTEAVMKIKRVAYFWRNLLLDECARTTWVHLPELRAENKRLGIASRFPR